VCVMHSGRIVYECEAAAMRRDAALRRQWLGI
jgi:hypothetical protein